ncbi:30S ribosomal protein S4 [Desulfitibacter alkalitolerans]|uniref:30S ribosomal protein S4 n=1 Tax=Desulfitibacter alkalitolerans TaxID=264641 RepID=UPI000488538C|nr:30S ribosomal protein S4 [Desulfitibacter alkalitolerans]
MARYKESVCRLCRREGVKLYLKGDRCYTDKCGVVKRAYAPGQHGQRRKKPSEYGLQLREKQKARRFYGILEKQFRNYFYEADRQKGITGENLVRLLERRLDNVIYRLGLAGSRPEARQLVRHGHVTVNNKKVDIPSYLLKVGDEVAIKEKSTSSPKFKEIAEAAMHKSSPPWLEADKENLRGRVVAMPSREDIDVPLEEHLIVELYSR